MRGVTKTHFTGEANTDLNEELEILWEKLGDALDTVPTGFRIKVTLELLPKKKRAAALPF
jgi:hypothetical protein